MKIKKINIKNYRSCENVDFFPNDNLSALIGPNGSGKTTILSAIQLIINLFNYDGETTLDDIDNSTACELKTWYDLDGKKVIHTATMNIVTNEKNEDVIIFSQEKWYMFDITKSKKKISIDSYFFKHIHRYYKSKNFTLPSFFDGSGLNYESVDVIDKISNFVKSIKYYSASQFTNPSKCPISFEIETKIETDNDHSDRKIIKKPLANDHRTWLNDLYYEFKYKPDSFSQFIDIVGGNGIGLIQEITFKEIDISKPNYNVYTGGNVRKTEKINSLIIPNFKIDNDNFSPNQLSEGTFKSLALIFKIITDQSTILLIEEPEVCVHHGLLKSIIELIKLISEEKQIIFSTHSDTILDSLDLSHIYSVKKEKTIGTTIKKISKKLNKDELNALKYYLENEGSLGEFWKNGDLENA